MCTCSLSYPYAYGNVHISLGLFLSLTLPSVSKIGISVMSSAAGDNKLVEEPITSRWQAGGSGLSACHYLHIDISKRPDRPFLRLPWQATVINPGKEKGRGRESPNPLPHSHAWTKKYYISSSSDSFLDVHSHIKICIYTLHSLSLSVSLSLPPPQSCLKMIPFICEMVIVFL